jgi:hypothetical protein
MANRYLEVAIAKSLAHGDRSLFDQLVVETMADDAALTREEAMRRIFADRPQLYQSYAAEVLRGTPVATAPAEAVAEAVEAAKPAALAALITDMIRPRAAVHKRQGLGDLEAVAQVFADDPLLYGRYRQVASIRIDRPRGED